MDIKFLDRLQKELEVASKALFFARRDLKLHLDELRKNCALPGVEEAQWYLDLGFSIHKIEAEVDALTAMLEAVQEAER